MLHLPVFFSFDSSLNQEEEKKSSQVELLKGVHCCQSCRNYLKKLFVWCLYPFVYIRPGKCVSKFCAKYLHQESLEDEAYQAGDLCTTIQKSFLRWFMPFNILIPFLLGSALRWILVRFTKPPQHIRGLIL